MCKSIRGAVPAIVCLSLLVPAVQADDPPLGGTDPLDISYHLSALGGTRWAYTYDVMNISWTQPIQEFTIWFDRNTQRNLAIGTPNPPAGDWSELIAQPDLVLQADGFYDALSLTGGIAPGSHVFGFSVAFDWLGEGVPGAQPFEIIDPQNFHTLYSGTTIPEPACAVLLLAGATAFARRGRR